MKVLYHESVNELDELRRDIVKLKVVPAAVKHWENVFKVIGHKENHNFGETFYLIQNPIFYLIQNPIFY